MPCRSDYLESNQLEKKGAVIYALLDELKTGKHVNSKSANYKGYDERVYCNPKFNKYELDKLTSELCMKLHKKKPAEIKNMSLEMQIWWRDHQEFDRNRIKQELKDKKKKELKKKAIAKLTVAELEALGIEWEE